MKKTLISTSILLTLTLGMAGFGSHQRRKTAATDKGLESVAAHQNADGSWSNTMSSWYNTADTGATLCAFTEQKYKPLGWNGKDYSTVLTKATDYLLKQATTLSFAPTGNWWGFGAGSSGIQWTSPDNESTYITGLTIPALSRLVTNPYGGAPVAAPGTVISSTNGVVNGKTYAEVIQKAVDSFTYYQSGPATGNREGGWRYFAGSNDSDMSTTQWPVIGYLFADQVPGVTIPDGTVKTALKKWLTAVQYP